MWARGEGRGGEKPFWFGHKSQTLPHLQQPGAPQGPQCPKGRLAHPFRSWSEQGSDALWFLITHQ